MKKQISHFSVHQSSKVIAILHFVFAAIFSIPWGLYVLFSAGSQESFIVFLIPFFYLIFSYICFAIFAALYNLVASTFGGIEVSFIEKGE